MTIQQRNPADRDNQLNYYAEKLDYEIDSRDLNAALENGDDVIIVDTRSPEARYWRSSTTSGPPSHSELRS